ncbi:CinA family nicotinamide mononucleotide deamidase-related protein [Rosenbergiella australiborealis]|uniref:CinA family nicotinamide mononucleotide deamidase-related protein n=1 Tax=Rosenbergiella australiborealis TaxID=1544696 RepID=UPI001F4E5004
MKVEMLSTGDEVLHGDIVDTNAVWLATTFYEAGYAMTFRTTSGDSLATLVETLQQRSQVADILIVNGGLGPTSDDYTAQAAAQAAGVGLVRNEEWLVQLNAFFARRGSEMAAINLKQADIPEGAEMLPNGNGTACGFRLCLNECQIFFTPGPPAEFQLMVMQQVLPRLRKEFPTPQQLLCLRLTTFGRGESFIAAQLAQIMLPDGVNLGYRAASPIVEVKLSGSEAQRASMLACWQKVKTLLNDYLLFEGKDNFAKSVAELLIAQHYRLQLCEGFSAGLLYWTLADVQAPLSDAQITTHYLGGVEKNGAVKTYHAAKKTSQPHQIFLMISPIIESDCLEFSLVTPQNTYQFRVTVPEHLLATRQKLQEIVVLQALYLLHRWLTDQPVNIIYQGFEVNT